MSSTGTIRGSYIVLLHMIYYDLFIYNQYIYIYILELILKVFADSYRFLKILTGSPALVQAFAQELDLEHPRVKILQCSLNNLVVQVRCLKFFKDLSMIFLSFFLSFSVQSLNVNRLNTPKRCGQGSNILHLTHKICKGDIHFEK